MTSYTLADLGWSNFPGVDEIPEGTYPCRVSSVHRHRVTALSPEGRVDLSAPEGTGTIAVGDWVLAEGGGIVRVLDRKSLLKRRAPGEEAREQLIAANVDTLGIVTSCNDDFNPARIERYLVVAAEAGCLPLVILTKADQVDDTADFVRRTEALSPLLTALAIDATDSEDIERLAPWCRTGQTLALVGSSGVGKTTIRNALTGGAAATQEIREDDAKGRHTTTSREMARTHTGGWLIDTPGMRALRLADVSDGISAVFEDIEMLATQCRFSDCAHGPEPGCSIQNAVAAGQLDGDRVRRWQKLTAEEARHSETLAAARARDKGFGKMVRSVKARKRQDRGES